MGEKDKENEQSENGLRKCAKMKSERMTATIVTGLFIASVTVYESVMI